MMAYTAYQWWECGGSLAPAGGMSNQWELECTWLQLSPIMVYKSVTQDGHGPFTDINTYLYDYRVFYCLGSSQSLLQPVSWWSKSWPPPAICVLGLCIREILETACLHSPLLWSPPLWFSKLIISSIGAALSYFHCTLHIRFNRWRVETNIRCFLFNFTSVFKECHHDGMVTCYKCYHGYRNHY